MLSYQFQQHQSFRPLDGESFSKQDIILTTGITTVSFRPLDGESFSKRTYTFEGLKRMIKFPSPRRGIIF